MSNMHTKTCKFFHRLRLFLDAPYKITFNQIQYFSFTGLLITFFITLLFHYNNTTRNTQIYNLIDNLFIAYFLSYIYLNFGIIRLFYHNKTIEFIQEFDKTCSYFKQTILNNVNDE